MTFRGCLKCGKDSDVWGDGRCCDVEWLERCVLERGGEVVRNTK